MYGSRRDSSSGEPPAKMKRSNRDDDSKSELRFLIPTEMAGSIIGKQGSKIKALREEYPSMRFSIQDAGGPERIMSMNQNNLEDCYSLLRHLFKDLATDFSRSALTDGKSNRDHDGDNVDLRLLVHFSLCGGIIGKQGSRIKEFRETPGITGVKVHQECCPESTDRVVQLSGEQEAVLNVLNNIITQINSEEVRGRNVKYNADNFNVYYTRDYGGYEPRSARGSMGRRGGMGMGMGGGRDKGGRGSNFGGSGGSGVYNDGFGGLQPGFGMAMMGFGPNAGAFDDNFGDDGDFPSGFGGFGSGGMRRGGGGGGGGGGLDGPVSTQQVSIPDNYTGAIMGKAGSRIKQIREESGCQIKIDAPGEKGDKEVAERVITISGTPDQIQYAQFLLQMCVKKYAR